MSREVLLIGGGHAHVEVIRRWAISPVLGASLVVLDPNPRPVYSGMVPGFVAGQYGQEELEIDLEALCRRAGADFICERASAVDPARHCVRLVRGDSIRYDIASIDIGSTVAGADLPGVREFGLSSRPITGLLSKVDSFVSQARRDAAGDLHVNVVGAGAGGVELAFCLDARLRSAGCRALILGKRLRAYAPQSDFLSLLNLGDGTAIGTKWGLALAGPALMRLKDRIDRSFMEKYR